jgi:hypothetical protein
MKKYKHKITGLIAILRDNVYKIHNDDGVFQLTKEIVENSNYWELITTTFEEKPYRQKSFETIKRITGFTPSQSDIDEIQHALNDDLNDYVEDKKPILTTHDGVDLFEGDKYFPIHNRYITNGAESTVKQDYKKCNYTHEDYIIFSTKEKAQEYIDYNKPKYSLNDIKNDWLNVWEHQSNYIINNLKKLNRR